MNHLSVLLCDQDKASRKLLNDYLSNSSRMKFNVREATTNKQIERALDKGKTPDIVILALNLTGKSMLEWLDEIVNAGKAPALVLAQNGDEMIAVEAMKRGALDYIPKGDLTGDMLTSAIIQVRDRWNHMRAIEDERLELERMAMFDSLTDLMSRRALMEQMDIEMVRSRRYGHYLSILMVDIDLFKRVNDNYGHIVGDQVIRDVTMTLKEQIRRNDFAGRYGGEEFIVMLPETPLEKALLLAEKLRKQVSHLTVISEGHTISGITISLGAAEYIKDESIDDFIDRSDKGLYMAKDAGRNRVATIS